MEERLRELLNVGREHYARREYDRAETALRRVLEVTDRFADVYHMLAVILHDRGDLPGAERLLERAIEINPLYTEALATLSVVYTELGKYEAARRIFKRIEGSQQEGVPDFVLGKIANMHADLAHAYMDAGRIQEAIEQLTKAVELCPGFSDLQTKLGNLYRESGDPASARDRYVAALATNPRYIPARLMLGSALLSLGEASQAANEWRAVLALDPNNANAKMHLRLLEEQQEASASSRPRGGVQEPTEHDPVESAMLSDDADGGSLLS